MDLTNVKIGAHQVEMSVSEDFTEFIQRNYRLIDNERFDSDIKIIIKSEYGVAFVDYHVEITKKEDKIFFQRADYMIEASLDYTNAIIFAHDELALKHAMTNLYSSFIINKNWGLLIHSSCAVEKGRAYVFAGHSGAGKSTVARLSVPRPLLSDEATLVQITSNGVVVHDSPFNSEIELKNSDLDFAPLSSIHILYQALSNNRVSLKKSDALFKLMDKVFYWNHNPEETKRVFKLLKALVQAVPAYELHFQKNNSFWELIS
jgi:hypothetical protein